MKIKLGTNFYHPIYGESVVENYDDTSNMYIARRKGGSDIFYVTSQQIRGGI